VPPFFISNAIAHSMIFGGKFIDAVSWSGRVGLLMGLMMLWLAHAQRQLNPFGRVSLMSSGVGRIRRHQWPLTKQCGLG